jgi:hypothetical protein
MTRDDPEQRIADLERQLVEHKADADLPQLRTLDTAASRRFVATAAPPTTKQMMRYTQAFFAVAIASLGVIYMALFLIGAIVGSTAVMQVGGTVAFFGFFLLAMPVYAAFSRRINREKTVLLDVRTDGLMVSTKPGVVFAASEAQLGGWTLEGYAAATKGTALHLRRDRDSFVLGGRDHRVASGMPLEAPPVDHVDAWVWPTEFDELLSAVGRRRGLEPTPPQPIRCPLVPNPAKLFSYSLLGMFKNTATALSLNANPPRPSLAIDVGDDTVSVIDLTNDAVIASAPPAQMRATPAASTRSMPRVGEVTTAVLVVHVPNSQPLTIGCPDFAGPRKLRGRARPSSATDSGGAMRCLLRKTGVRGLGSGLADPR